MANQFGFRTIPSHQVQALMLNAHFSDANRVVYCQEVVGEGSYSERVDHARAHKNFDETVVVNEETHRVFIVFLRVQGVTTG